jgi:prefoldin subunit 5
LNLEVGSGLIVQLTPAEAQETIPKIKALLQEKVEKVEREVRRIFQMKKQFAANFETLMFMMNPLLAGLQLN